MANPLYPGDLIVEPIVRQALLEDLGRAGDITTAAVVPDGTTVTAAVVAREPGTFAGIQVAALAFRLVDPTIACTCVADDGAHLDAGATIMNLSGPAAGVLAAERVALNFLGRLSGIATATAVLVDLARPHKARITCTRKTTPNLRILEKAAVRAGGGVNHRFGLDDAVLIKDNHVALAGGVARAVERARAAVGHLVKIEVEVDTLDQLEDALGAGPDAVLLDNMDPETLTRAVTMVDGRIPTEASGGITAKTVQAVAATGVDLISVGWLTHSARSLDVALDIA